MTGTTDCPIWCSCAADRPDWWRPLAPNPWPGDTNAYPCPWGCNGTGRKPEFAHIQGGACFGCHGTGWILGRGLRSAPIKRGNSSRRKWRKEAGRLVPV
jgi:hypothetical protein